MGEVALRSNDGEGMPLPESLQSSPIFTNPLKTAILYIVVSKRGGGTMERELEQLEGTVEDIIYQNEDNG